ICFFSVLKHEIHRAIIERLYSINYWQDTGIGARRVHLWDSLLNKIPPEYRKPMSQRLRRLVRPAWLGTLRRTTPLSDRFGSDRGTPVDRYYIENFLEEHRQDIRGRVLEVKDSDYTDRYGTAVERREVLDIDPAN